MNAHFQKLVDDYVEYRKARGFAQWTEYHHRRMLGDFFGFLPSLGIHLIHEIDEKAARAFYAFLTERPLRRKLTGHREAYARPFACTIKVFFDWATVAGHILVHPCEGIFFKRLPDSPPRNWLTIAEVNRLLVAPDLNTTTGLRNKAMIELMYSTGIRKLEVVRLDLPDVDMIQRRLFIRLGKGMKDRVVPFGVKAQEWLERYLSESRPIFERDSSNLAVFLTERGERIRAVTFDHIFEKYRAEAGITKMLTAYTLRHTCATHMLQAGADIRYVKELLGHVSIETTKQYTHLAEQDVMDGHRKHHPRGGRKPLKSDEDPSS